MTSGLSFHEIALYEGFWDDTMYMNIAFWNILGVDACVVIPIENTGDFKNCYYMCFIKNIFLEYFVLYRWDDKKLLLRECLKTQRE